MSAEPKYQKAPGITEFELADEVMLHSPTGEEVFSLHPSARQIWDLCDGSRTVAQISEEIAAQFGAAGDAILADVERAVADLEKRRLLLRAGAAAPAQ